MHGQHWKGPLCKNTGPQTVGLREENVCVGQIYEGDTVSWSGVCLVNKLFEEIRHNSELTENNPSCNKILNKYCGVIKLTQVKDELKPAINHDRFDVSIIVNSNFPLGFKFEFFILSTLTKSSMLFLCNFVTNFWAEAYEALTSTVIGLKRDMKQQVLLVRIHY